MMIRTVDVRHASAIETLERRLAAFYDTAQGYYDCSSDSDKSRFVAPIVAIARSICERKGHVNVLEIGAGKSQAPELFLRGLRGLSYRLDLQDINDRNASFHERWGVKLHAGPIDCLPADRTYDLVFGLFVYEHLCAPIKVLDALRARLEPHGTIVLVSPEYVMPFYVPPALRHLPAWKRWMATMSLFLSSLLTRVTGTPSFRVFSEPAVFHGTWRRDADAVHMVSKADLVAYFGDAFEISDLDLKFPQDLRSFIASKCLLRVVARKKT
jgi:hypothetical protein